MTNLKSALPEIQSRILLAAGLAALFAAGLGSAVYAFQSASASQEIYGIPTDALIKTVLAIAADIGVALGAAVTAWLWWSGRKTYQRQAVWAIGATALAFALGVTNLSGYSAWTRAQHAADAARANPLYTVAQANAERAAADPRYFVSGTDRRLLEAAQTPDTAQRDFGDVVKATGLHILVLLFGFAYRLPTRRKPAKRKAKQSRAQGKPKLAVVK